MCASYGLFSLEGTLVRELVPTIVLLHRGASAFKAGRLLLAAMCAVMSNLVNGLALHRCPEAAVHITRSGS